MKKLKALFLAGMAAFLLSSVVMTQSASAQQQKPSQAAPAAGAKKGKATGDSTKATQKAGTTANPKPSKKKNG